MYFHYTYIYIHTDLPVNAIARLYTYIYIYTYEEYVIQGNDGKNIYKILKSPCISIQLPDGLKTIVILFYPDYHCHNTQKYFRLTQYITRT